MPSLSLQSSKKWTSYDTVLKHLAREDLLPNSYLNGIDRTLIWRWKSMAQDKFTGFELSVNAQYHYDTIRRFSQNQKAIRIFRAYTRLIKTFTDIANTCADFKARLRQKKEKIVDLIQRIRPVIGNKIPLRIFGISIQTLAHWLRTAKVKCSLSFLEWCKKSYPHQLTSTEVRKIKSLLTDVSLAHWPICSVAYYALRQNLVSASVHSWYRYAGLLGVVRPKLPSRRKKQKVGIRASSPGEIIHADVTKFRLSENITACIYIVVDNFSRCVLSWKAETFLSATAMKGVLLDAAGKLHSGNTPMLITDKGSENARVQEISHVFEHQYAQSDIDFSNSIIEAVNKIIKYQYLYPKEISNIAELKNILRSAFNDYNNVRPHYSLNGLTPSEAFAGHSASSLHTSKKLRIAKQRRLIINRKEKCLEC